MPPAVADVRIDNPGWAGREGIVNDYLETRIIVSRIGIGPIAEEARRSLQLTDTIGHASERAMLFVLRPIHTPFEFVVLNESGRLGEVVVKVVWTLARPVGQRE